MRPVYVLVCGIEVILHSFELYHIYEVLETTIDKVDNALYENMKEKYGDKYAGTSNFILRLIVCARDIMPPFVNKGEVYEK